MLVPGVPKRRHPIARCLRYKREKVNLETRLQELEKSTVDHDDHIRIVDAWLLQVGGAHYPTLNIRGTWTK